MSPPPGVSNLPFSAALGWLEAAGDDPPPCGLVRELDERRAPVEAQVDVPVAARQNPAPGDPVVVGAVERLARSVQRARDGLRDVDEAVRVDMEDGGELARVRRAHVLVLDEPLVA